MAGEQEAVPSKKSHAKAQSFDISSLSEFPSLSGGPQSQTPNPGQAIWANANQRTTAQGLTQRQPQAPIASQQSSRAPQPQGHQQQTQSHPSHDDILPSGTQFAAQLDDFRNGGQGISGQLSGGAQPQPSSIDDFPPLGGSGTPKVDINQERRDNMLQAGDFGSYGGGKSGMDSEMAQKLIVYKRNCNIPFADWAIPERPHTRERSKLSSKDCQRIPR